MSKSEYEQRIEEEFINTKDLTEFQLNDSEEKIAHDYFEIGWKISRELTLKEVRENIEEIIKINKIHDFTHSKLIRIINRLEELKKELEK